MKKLLIALVLLTSFQLVNAQDRAFQDAKNDIQSAIKRCANPGWFMSKAGAYFKLGDTYVKAYETEQGNVLMNMSLPIVETTCGQPVSKGTQVLNGTSFIVLKYPLRILYFSLPGKTLAAVKVISPIDTNLLQKAVEAYRESYKLKKSYKEDATHAILKVENLMMQKAQQAYTLGDFAASHRFFAKAADACLDEPVAKIDTNATYNASLTAEFAKDTVNAIKYYKICYDNKFYKNGDIYARLAALDTAKASKYLEEGFKQYPQSQPILVGLINYYMSKKSSAGSGSERLFNLIHQAMKNDPKNASLYLVEGNVYAKLGKDSLAVLSYEKCSKIDPKYVYGDISIGQMYFNEALKIQTKAQNEQDNDKYNALMKDFDSLLKKCIPPFESAFNLTTSKEVKVGVAQYLKNIYYRFRTQGPEYKAAYEKYAAVVSAAKAGQSQSETPSKGN